MVWKGEGLGRGYERRSGLERGGGRRMRENKKTGEENIW